VLDIAEEVELVDIAPEELLKRLAEGKVYTQDKPDLRRINFSEKEILSLSGRWLFVMSRNLSITISVIT